MTPPGDELTDDDLPLLHRLFVAIQRMIERQDRDGQRIERLVTVIERQTTALETLVHLAERIVGAAATWPGQAVILALVVTILGPRVLDVVLALKALP